VSQFVPTLIIGVGNPDRGDDGAGRLVARLLRHHALPGVTVEEQNGAAADLVDRLANADSVMLIDAAVTGAQAGTIHTIDCTTGTAAIPTYNAASSHGLGVAEAIALARVLQGLPRICRLYAIEGVTFTPGAAMSQAVTAAAEELAVRLARTLSSA
jgi:hydrogenase maturation protease